MRSTLLCFSDRGTQVLEYSRHRLLPACKGRTEPKVLHLKIQNKQFKSVVQRLVHFFFFLALFLPVGLDFSLDTFSAASLNSCNK